MKLIHEAVEKHEKLILDAERHIWKNPETGYKEFKTNEYMIARFLELGYDVRRAEGITGFYTVVDTGRDGPEVLVLCELDSVICPEHPESDKETGAVHACGHNAQCAALLGVAAALTEDGVLDSMSGRIRLCAVPAEELLEIEYRRKLKEEGKISYFGGKSEFLSRGYFDGVDIALMVHTSKSFMSLLGSAGCIAKNIIYKGKAAHAGGSPQNGINALYAASLGLNAINAIRETFREIDQVRVHPIITSGGSMVNAIPETARLESYVRGRSFEAIEKENKKVNRALIGAALSIGANIEIIDIPGYAPLDNDKNMLDMAKRAYLELFPDREFNIASGYSTGSTDMGDLSQIMPVIHPYSKGSVGDAHGANYYIDDPYSACVECAKWQVAMLHMLLSDKAREAIRIKNEFTPRFASKEEYLNYLDSIASSGDRITYTENGAEVKL